jgi:hypothetical protein
MRLFENYSLSMQFQSLTTLQHQRWAHIVHWVTKKSRSSTCLYFVYKAEFLKVLNHPII